MKRIFKAFLLCSICLVLSSFVKETYAAYIPGTKCPEAPDKSLDSICGVVKSAKPTRVVDSDGKVTYEQPIGVPGVSVYVYECDNQSPSCKLSGDLVHPFSSTSTNQDGMFYLWARKLDTFITPPSGGVARNFSSKKRYLVFSCGYKIAGIQTIPSYLDLTYVIQEVDCGPVQGYVSPQNRLSILPSQATIPSLPSSTAPGDLLANQMGNDMWAKRCEEYEANGPASSYEAWCNVTSGSYVNHLTAQFSFKPQQSATAPSGFAPINNMTPNVSMNFDLNLENADPRFRSGAAGGQDYIEATNLVFNPNINPFNKGSWWSRDCWIKYEGDEFNGVKDTNFCMPIDQIESYTTSLYTDPDFLIQNKLPNIPPINSLLFYKEFPARQDLTEFIQDPTDTAKFLSLQFSNCIGSVFLRKDGQAATDKYVACSQFKKCSGVLSSEGSYLNNQTAGGPSAHLASPTTFQDEYEANVDLKTPVCKINPDDPNETPKNIEDIQPPWESSMDGYELDSSYWSPELIYYFGKNNVTSKYGVAFEGYNDSFYGSGSYVNTQPFTTGQEAAVQPVRGGTFAMFPSGGNKPNNSMASAVAISSNTTTNDSSNSLTSLLSSPLKAQDPLYEFNILRGIVIPTTGSKTLRIGEYSKVNAEPEKVVGTPNDDQSIISNILFKGDPDHHPLVDPIGGLSNGTRTPTSTIYLTDPAKLRIQAMEGKSSYDVYDSFLSIIYGEGTLDFGWDKIPVWIFNAGNAFLQNLFYGANTKSFLDRKNAEETLPIASAEPRNDLQAKFSLSESNFNAAFPLPTPPIQGPGDWGADGCYPWHLMSIPTDYPVPDDQKCNTDKTESPVQISRTCRVDQCLIITIDCTCTETPVWDYTKIPPVINHYHYSQNCNRNSHDECTPNDRLICAQNQLSCIDSDGVNENCINKVYPDPVAAANAKKNPCNAAHVGDQQIFIVGAPACQVSMAGPYTCGGELKKDSEFITRSAPLPDNPRTVVPPQNADSMGIANNELRKSLQSPFEAKLTYAPAAFESGDSSIRDTGVSDITKRKDTVGAGGDTQNASITRAMWQAPIQMSDPVYNKINLHCNIADGPDGGSASFVSNITADEQIGVLKGGNWTCDVNEPPNPEVVDLNEYFNRHPVDSSCSLKPSDACISALYPSNTGNIEFSDTFVKILNAAASRVKVPASLILSAAKLGKATMYGYYFTPDGEEDLKDASFPWYGNFPGCDEMNSASVGVYDWIRVWFDAEIQGELKTGGQVKDVLEELAVGRSKTAARCNFLDSTFVIAAALKNNSGNVNSEDCTDFTPANASKALGVMLWGSDGSAAPSGWQLPGQIQDIFNACR